MTDYYGILLLILAVFQEEVKGYVGGFVCSVVAFSNEGVQYWLMKYAGYDFFESILIFDTIALMCVFLVCRFSGVARYLIIAFVLSIFTNIFYILAPPHIYSNTILAYKSISIIYFEIMVWGLLLHTTFYPKLKQYLPHVTTPCKQFAEEYDKAIRRSK